MEEHHPAYLALFLWAGSGIVWYLCIPALGALTLIPIGIGLCVYVTAQNAGAQPPPPSAPPAKSPDGPLAWNETPEDRDRDIRIVHLSFLLFAGITGVLAGMLLMTGVAGSFAFFCLAAAPVLSFAFVLLMPGRFFLAHEVLPGLPNPSGCLLAIFALWALVAGLGMTSADGSIWLIGAGGVCALPVGMVFVRHIADAPDPRLKLRIYFWAWAECAGLMMLGNVWLDHGPRVYQHYTVDRIVPRALPPDQILLTGSGRARHSYVIYRPAFFLPGIRPGTPLCLAWGRGALGFRWHAPMSTCMGVP